MEKHTAFSIDDLVRTKLSFTGSREATVAPVTTPTLDTPPSDDVNPMEWLTNPVGLDVTPRYKVSWEEAGEIISPASKYRTPALA